MIAMQEMIMQWGAMWLDASWQGAVLALVVVTICYVVGNRLSANWRVALWGLVFVRLACPVLPSSPLSAWNLLPAQREETTLSQHTTSPLPQSPDSLAISQPAPADTDLPESKDLSTETTTSDAIRQQEEIQTSSTSLSLIERMWLAGVFVWGVIASVLVMRQLVLQIKLRRLTAEWIEVTDPDLVQLSDECRQQVGLRRSVSLLKTDAPIGPATLGIWHARIVLPTSLIDSASTDELRMILMHELHHVCRWDVLWDRLVALLTAAHWFNPAVWWAKARVRDEQEQACDAAVLQHIGLQQARSYGRLLMKLTEEATANRSPAILVSAQGSTRSLHRRIVMITEFKPTNWKRSLLGACVVAVLVMVGLTSAQTREADETKPDTDTPQSVAQSTSDQPSAYVISGQCIDENGQPLSDVRVRVFRICDSKETRKLVGEVQTDQSGNYRFEDLAPPIPAQLGENQEPDVEYFDEYHLVVATKPGRASQFDRYGSSRHSHEIARLEMPPSSVLSGRVTDEAGRPIQGAQVFSFCGFSTPIEGVQCAITDAEGRYEIKDLKAWDADLEPSQDLGNGLHFQTALCRFNVLHPDYGEVHPEYTKIPARIDVALQRAAVIEGQVFDQVTGQPAVGTTVFIQGVHPTNGFQRAITDEQGRYRLTSINPGTYNVMVQSDKRVGVATESLEVAAGETYSDQVIDLIDGSWIEGRIVDAKTDEPISHTESGQQLTVGVYGPARPKSSGGVNIGYVADDGRFRIRVAPGMNYPYIMISDIRQRTEGDDLYEKGIEVGDGEIVSLKFRVLPEKPRKKPKFSPVRLKVPVPKEREAVAAVRRLGG